MMYLRKIIVALLIVPLVAGPLMSLGAREARAAVPSFETNPLVVQGIVNTQIQQTLSTTIENVLNGIAWAAAKTVIQAMTRSIVTWINSGFEGSPAFEQNLTLGLRSLLDQSVAITLNQLSQSDIVQSPFLEKVLMGVGAGYYLSSSEERLQQRLRYTLNQVSANDRAFLAGDFSQGGFNAWFSAWMNNANNPIGAQFMLGQELARQLETQAFQRVQELAWGRGFLSWRGDCLLQGSTNNTQNANAGHEGAHLGGEDNCLQYDIQTPGSFIEGQLGITAASPLRQLELADSINEIVSALMTQMVTQIIGSTGLLGSTKPSTGGGKSLLDQATDPKAAQGEGVKSQVEKAISDTQKYQAGWGNILAVANKAEIDCVNDPDELAQAESTAGIAQSSVNKAIEALPALQAILQALSGSPSPAALTAASDQFVALMSSGDVPTSAEATNAEQQSANTPGSLYSQMVELAAQCQ